MLLHSAGGWNWSTQVSFYQLLPTSERACEGWLLGLTGENTQLKQLQVCKLKSKRRDLTFRKHQQHQPSSEFPPAPWQPQSQAEPSKYCKSCHIKGLKASDKPRPYRSFSAENTAAGSHSRRSPPSRCVLTNCRELALCSTLGEHSSCTRQKVPPRF